MLTGNEICREFNAGRIRINPFRDANVNPNSYNLTLSPKMLVYANPVLDMAVEEPVNAFFIPEEGIVLSPNILYLGCTNEEAGSDHFVPMLEGRSSVARLGLEIHRTGGFGDVGFYGHWTLEISVI